jgi:D-3-phosphoglycerate dehydrogenase
MTDYHILVTDPLHAAGLTLFAETAGIILTAPGKMGRGAALAAVPQAHALIVRSGTQADRELIEVGAKLRVICRAGVGVDNIDIEAATERGIAVMNTPEGNTVATAELTLGLMLALARHIGQASASLGAGEWDRRALLGTELRGKTLGIVGLGRVGSAVARRAAAFEMRIIAYDPYVDAERAAGLGAESVSWPELLAQSDYITLHVSLTPKTRRLINSKTIAAMKDGVRIINAARGALVDEEALAQAIKSGKVAGAAIDVYSAEPPHSNPLIGLPGVVHTPHLGASTTEAQEAVAIQAARQVLAALLEGDYRNVLNPEVLTR